MYCIVRQYVALLLVSDFFVVYNSVNDSKHCRELKLMKFLFLSGFVFGMVNVLMYCLHV